MGRWKCEGLFSGGIEIASYIHGLLLDGEFILITE